MKKGRIIKSLSGFYYVYDGKDTYQTRARGVFRKQDITPLTGDFVSFEADNLQEGYVLDIHTRKNELQRPPIANIDIGLCICSAVSPSFSSSLLDRFLVHLEKNHIAPIIILTKADLIRPTSLKQLTDQLDYYQSIGYPYVVSHLDQTWTADNQSFIKRNIKNRTAMVMGQSGAGKSTLLNKFAPQLELETKDVSKALGRGKHTTRHVELLPLFGGWIADTPGFSSLDFEDMHADELKNYYPDFQKQATDCKFAACVHVDEPQCAVRQAVEEGIIPQSRYDYYLRMYHELKEKKVKY